MAYAGRVTCPKCGSEDVTNRQRRFLLFVAILCLAAVVVVLGAWPEGFGWATIAALGGLAFAVLVNILSAIYVPWLCVQCKHVWRDH
jgi:hypothetical protein